MSKENAERMVNMKKVGLVLEGGGERGVFTSGVLDYMMEEKFGFLMSSVYRPAPAMRSIMYPASLIEQSSA